MKRSGKKDPVRGARVEWPAVPKGYRIVLRGVIRKGDLVLQSSTMPNEGRWIEPSISYYALARPVPRRSTGAKGRGK